MESKILTARIEEFDNVSTMEMLAIVDELLARKSGSALGAFRSQLACLLKSGAGVCVGLPLAAHPAMRGGVESEASMAGARRFLPRQVIIASLRCNEGVLQIFCEDGCVLLRASPRFVGLDVDGRRSRLVIPLLLDGVGAFSAVRHEKRGRGAGDG